MVKIMVFRKNIRTKSSKPLHYSRGINMTNSNEKYSNNLQQEWVYKEYVNRENLIIHAPMEPEMDFYNAVAAGDRTAVEKYLQEDFLKKEGLGKLSDDSVRNGIYHFAITAALIARACIKAGLSMEESYSLSDFYIQKVDKTTSIKNITRLHDEMALVYTEKMKQIKKGSVYPKPIIKCINYIYSHLHTRIVLEELAEHVGLSPSYLSKLFKKETGTNINAYISEQKVATAKNMLLYSNYSPSQIAQILAYPSQSYFTECFRKSTGVTPGQYYTSFR